jgi:folate-binding protein YgfZ
MFVLRSQVQLEEQPDSPAPDARTPLEEILAGIPEIYPETRELFVPQMLNLDSLDAIDFKKGCYPGQEIVARTQYLGDVKRRMYLCESEAGDIAPGTSVLSGAGTEDETVGTVVRATTHAGGNRVLAVLQTTAPARPDLRLALPGRPRLSHPQTPVPAAG